MKETIKRHLISLTVTFVGFFFFTFGAALMQESFDFSKSALSAAILSAGLAGVRACAKIIWEIGKELISKNK